MTIDIRYVVQGEIVSDDTQLLDVIQANLPDEDGVVVGQEWAESRQPETDQDGTETGTEVLRARMAFAEDTTEFADGPNGEPQLVVDREPPVGEDEVSRSQLDPSEIYGPEQAAIALYDAVAASDLANRATNWSLKVYRSPQGAVTSDAVTEWYEANPDARPTRETVDGDTEQFTPASWQADHHIIRETSG